jgi:hypothetical protein
MLRRSVLWFARTAHGEEDTSMNRRSSRFGLRARTWAVALLAMILAAALFAQPASATTPTQGSGTFTFAAAVTGSRSAGGNTFLSLTGSETISGAIIGTATVQFTQVIHSSGESNINGVITCACTVGGRSGTVEFSFEGTGAGTAASPFDGQFVAQNGSGGLSDLRVNGTFHGVGPGGTYTVRWHFDP